MSIKQYIGVRFVLISRIRVFAAPVPEGVHACGICTSGVPFIASYNVTNYTK